MIQPASTGCSMMRSPNRRIIEDLPPASLETRRHREFKCGVYFAPVGTHGQNKRNGFLKEYGEGEELSIIPPLACPELCRRAPGVAPRNRGGIFNSGMLAVALAQAGAPELQMPPHPFLPFPPALCLRVSSEAGGESSLEFGYTRDSRGLNEVDSTENGFRHQFV